jgi:hypothetical protein
MGLPPIAEELARQEAEFKGLSEERQALIARRLREAEDKRSSGQLGAFLRSARGRSLGETLGAAERGREAFEAGLTGQIRGFEDLQLEIRGLQIQKQNALNKMRDEIAMGDYQGAMQSGEKAREAQNALQRLYADVSTKEAKDISDEFRTRMTVEEQARGRAEAVKQRSAAEQERTMLAAQGRLTEAEKARAQVAEKNRDRLALPKDAKDPLTQQMRANAEREIRQAEANVEAARALYNRIVNQTLGGAGASQMTESQRAALAKYSGKQ